jgi:hypothetical protein
MLPEEFHDPNTKMLSIPEVAMILRRLDESFTEKLNSMGGPKASNTAAGQLLKSSLEYA